MAGDARILYARKPALLDERVAVADAASFDLDAHRACARLWHIALHEFKGAIRLTDLHDKHLRHSASNLSSQHTTACKNQSRPEPCYCTTYKFPSLLAKYITLSLMGDEERIRPDGALNFHTLFPASLISLAHRA